MRPPGSGGRARPASGEPNTWTRQFAGSAPGDGAVGEHDHLVDPCGERPQLGHRGPEHRVVRVDLLRREDEPAHQRKSRSPSSKCQDGRAATAPRRAACRASRSARRRQVAGAGVAPVLPRRRRGATARPPAAAVVARTSAAVHRGDDAEAAAPRARSRTRCRRRADEQLVRRGRADEAPVEPVGVAEHPVAARGLPDGGAPRRSARGAVPATGRAQPRPHPERAGPAARCQSSAGAQNRRRRGVRHDQQQRHAELARALLVGRAQLDEHAATRGSRVGRERGPACRPPRPSADRHRAGSSSPRVPRRLPSSSPSSDRCRPHRVPLEQPLELALLGPLAPDPLHQRDELGTPRRLVARR